jgi:hypothetical protein
MPELPVKEVRLPELHLPEITREEIIRTLSEARRPDFDLRWFDRPRRPTRSDVLMSRLGSWRPAARASSVPRVAPPTVDLARLATAALGVVGIARPRPARRRGLRPRLGRSGWGLVAGLVVAAGIGVVVVGRNQAARERFGSLTRGVGSRFTGIRNRTPETLEVEPDDPNATAPMSIDATDGTGMTAPEPVASADATGAAGVAAEPPAEIEPPAERPTEEPGASADEPEPATTMA